ncbi:SMP-30/gluconolactonase/LRE family protein [Dactylosporangium sucinum]|uniref:Calcium-binding protein n=1 Tax=Dactylosporangium sucinum TaxID=1424081 RepID=A0A917TSL3_9ACTN|nr:SMP-30/gluconolactonase/LRE family protein [Dactylosporangium sucinum]GGM36365.1 calcium-binding protein [Dactylosporangium sucinum]
MNGVTSVAAGDELGEGPFWDVRTARLSWVDILTGRLRTTGDPAPVTVTSPLAFAIPRRDGGHVLGVGRDVVVRDPEGGLRTLAHLDGDARADRLNDAACDAAGRLWAGTMSSRREPGVAALYRIEPDGRVDCVLDGLTISNGLDWSPDGTVMYHIDSPAQRVDRYPFDAGTGRLGDRRTFAAIPAEDGLPDGLTVDAEGGVWVALFGGGAVRRYRADGTLDRVVPLPVSCPTSVAFGGATLRDLFVTSSRHKLDDAGRRAEPLAGNLFRLRPGPQGLPKPRFAG